MARSSFNRMVASASLKLMESGLHSPEDFGVPVRWTGNDGKEIPDPRVNLCARVMPELAGEVDSICGLLNISKRRFIEEAIIESIRQAKEVMREEGLFDHLDEHYTDKPKKEGE